MVFILSLLQEASEEADKAAESGTGRTGSSKSGRRRTECGAATDCTDCRGDAAGVLIS